MKQSCTFSLERVDLHELLLKSSFQNRLWQEDCTRWGLGGTKTTKKWPVSQRGYHQYFRPSNSSLFRNVLHIAGRL